MPPPPPKRRRVDAPAASRPPINKKQMAPAIPPPPAIDEEIFHQRIEVQNKLKSAWESIFAKYEQDTSHYADEIDLETGEIVVDKGHLRGMQGETGEDLAEDLWANWSEAERSEEEVVDAFTGKSSKGLTNGQKNNCKPKPPKVFKVAGSLFGITDCELCAEQDELDFTPCTHNSDTNISSEKENTPRAPKLVPRTPAAKQSLAPSSKLQPLTVEVDDEDEDELCTSIPVTGHILGTRPSGLTPALNTLSIDITSAISRGRADGSKKQTQLLPSSPIARHVNRKGVTKAAETHRSSPPFPSSPPPQLDPLSPQKAKDPWAPSDDDPLADKIWHSHHPDGSPPRLHRRLPMFSSVARSPPSLSGFSYEVIDERETNSLPRPPRQPSQKANDKKQTPQYAQLFVDLDEKLEEYSADEETSGNSIKSVKIPLKPPADNPRTAKIATTADFAPRIQKIPTASSSGMSKTIVDPTNSNSISKTDSKVISKLDSTTKTPTRKPGEIQSRTLPKSSASIAAGISNKAPPKTPSKTPSRISSTAPPKTPSKTPSRISSKTPSKTPTKTPSKTPSKTPYKSSIKPPGQTPTCSISWSSQFDKKRKRMEDSSDSDSGSDSDKQEHSDDDGLKLLQYVKSRARTPFKPRYNGKEAMKPKTEEIGLSMKSKNLNHVKTLKISDSEEEGSKREGDDVRFRKQHMLSGGSNEAVANPMSALTASSCSVVIVDELRIKKEETDEEQYLFTKKPSQMASKSCLPKLQHTKSTKRQVAKPSTFLNPKSIMQTAIKEADGAGPLCGTKGYKCGKKFCWECIEAEDDHL